MKQIIEEILNDINMLGHTYYQDYDVNLEKECYIIQVNKEYCNYNVRCYFYDSYYELWMHDNIIRHDYYEITQLDNSLTLSLLTNDINKIIK